MREALIPGRVLLPEFPKFDLFSQHGRADDIHYTQPILFITLYFGYKLVKQTKFQRFKDVQNAYFMPEFDDDDDGELVAREGQGITRFVLGQVWSYIK
jgi:hypothetical protein